MKPAPFEYFAPKTVAEIVDLMEEYGFEARPLAGGQSLVPLINMRMAQPAVIIDLNHCADLIYLQEEPDALVLGAMTRQRELEILPVVQKYCPLITKVMPYMGHATIRNRGTVGGNLSHSDPSAELPGVALATDAEFLVEGPKGCRTVSAANFFLGELTTTLEPDEILREIRFPKVGRNTTATFAEIGSHFGGLAIVSVACQIRRDTAGRCQKVRLTATGVGDRPTRLFSAESILIGEVLNDCAVVAASEASTKDVDPSSDLHASAHWRRRAVVAMLRQVLNEAAMEL